MGHPKFIIANKMGESISIQRVNIHVRHRVPTEIQKHNSMIFHDQQCNFHEHLMHGLQPPLLNAEYSNSNPYLIKHACRPCMHFEIIKT